MGLGWALFYRARDGRIESWGSLASEMHRIGVDLAVLGDGAAVAIGSPCVETFPRPHSNEDLRPPGYVSIHGTSSAISESSETQRLAGESPLFGVSVASVGDLDGDSSQELAVGCPVPGAQGRIYLYELDDLGEPPRVIGGTEGMGWFGTRVVSMGDVNSDRAPDFVVTAPGQGWVGAYSGRSLGLLWEVRPDGEEREFGRYMCPIGDVNSSGASDIAVSCIIPGGSRVVLLEGHDGSRINSTDLSEEGEVCALLAMELGTVLLGVSFDHNRSLTTMVFEMPSLARERTVPGVIVGTVPTCREAEPDAVIRMIRGQETAQLIVEQLGERP